MIDARLDEVVLRALEKKPELRFQQVSTLKTQVEAISSDAAESEISIPKSKPPQDLSRLQSISLTVLSMILAALLALAGWTASELGIFFNALFFFVILMAPIRIALTLWRASRGSLEHRFRVQPWAGELRWHRWQTLNDWIFWLLAALTLELCIVPYQFTPHEYACMRVLYRGGILILVVLGLLPGKRIHPATNLVFAAGSIFMATQIARVYWPAPKTEGVVLSRTLSRRVAGLHGGRSKLINNHYDLKNQRDALDIERLVNGQERTGDRGKVESYPSWGETLYAPAAGKSSK